MSIKAVLVHSCFDGEVFGAVALRLAGRDSQGMFTDFAGPKDCKCAKKITISMRDARLNCGEVYVIRRPNALGHPVPAWNEVVERRKQAKVPRGATIEKAHMQRATNYSNWTEKEIVAEVRRLRSAIDIAHLRASEHDQNSPEYRFFLDEADGFRKTLGSIGAFRSERIRTNEYNTINQNAIASLGGGLRRRGDKTPVIPHELTMELPTEPCTTHWDDQRMQQPIQPVSRPPVPPASDPPSGYQTR